MRKENLVRRDGWWRVGGGVVGLGMVLLVGVGQVGRLEAQPPPLEATPGATSTAEGIAEGIGGANVETARRAVVLFQQREAEELFGRHTEKARRRLATPAGLAERAFRLPPCDEVEQLGERFTCYPEPTSTLDPFCVYDRRVLCEGRRESTLFHVSLEPGSGAIQRIQRIDAKPPSPWFWFGTRAIALVIVVGLAGSLVLGVVVLVFWWIRRLRQRSEAWMRRAAEALGSTEAIVPGKTAKIAGTYAGQRAAAGIERQHQSYYIEGRRRTRVTFHAWLRLDHPRPLPGPLRVARKPRQSGLARLILGMLGRKRPELGDPRFDQLYQLQVDELETARLLLATPHAGMSLAHRLIQLADLDLVLNHEGVIFRCPLAAAENVVLAQTLALLAELVERIDGARGDGASGGMV